MTSSLAYATEKQLTDARSGHILTNCNVWSPDSRRIVYDTRSDASGSIFDGHTIETVDIESAQTEVIYRSAPGVHCGVATYSPTDERVVFILGPTPGPDGWTYGASRRQGVVVDTRRANSISNLDARDLIPPFTPGALRGGSHVHVFDSSGQWVSFTYEDHFLLRQPKSEGLDLNQRNVGVSIPNRPVQVPQHARNHHGTHFSVLVTRSHNQPQPDSDQISRAYEDAWIGRSGYRRADGSWQRNALAFLGDCVTHSGSTITELYVVDLPEDPTQIGDGPLTGTERTRPCPPLGAQQRRITRTQGRKYPGLQGPRFWPRSSPDGGRIAFLMRDDQHIVQLWTVSPRGDALQQITINEHDVASAFTWSPDGRWIAHVMDLSVCLTEVATGRTHRLTAPIEPARSPRPEACVFSPDGMKIAYVRPTPHEDDRLFNQIFMVQPDFDQIAKAK